MNKLMLGAAFALALAGCENMNGMNGMDRMSAKPSGSPMKVFDQTVEAKAQDCTNRGFRPGTSKFNLCMNRAAERAVTNAPAPKARPMEPDIREAAAPEPKMKSSDDGVMDRIKGLFN